MKKVQIGLVGFGTVGTGVVKILRNNGRVIKERLGVPLVIKRIADIDITSDRGIKVERNLLTTRVHDILNDPSIDLVVELMGGIEPAKTILLSAIEKGKHVVTANKALLAEHGVELFKAAHHKRVDIGFEGSVAGGIPIIKAIKEGLSANRIRFILGILNGTANYILSTMTNEGGKFKDILRGI
jgi:homoserine dehydrogenase